MLPKNNLTNAIESSQRHTERIEKSHNKREWADPAMVEVMNATAVRNNCSCGTDGGGCGSIV